MSLILLTTLIHFLMSNMTSQEFSQFNVVRGQLSMLLDHPFQLQLLKSKIITEQTYHEHQLDLSIGISSISESFGAETFYAPFLKHQISQSKILPDSVVLMRDNEFIYHQGAIIRGDPNKKELALVFTGDEFADGAAHIRSVLAKYHIKASFFLTGNFYRNPNFKNDILDLKSDGHYLGAHSDNHLLYCDWNNRDSLLVSREQFFDDLKNNYAIMKQFGIYKFQARYFLPPFEWYNRTVADWTQQIGLTLINFSPGTKSHTDWTYPELGNLYQSSDTIMASILDFERREPHGLNGFILLLHIGSDPRRTDKFYHKLDQLIDELLQRGYRFKRIDELLK